MSQPHPLQPGDPARIGDYRISHRLGQGGQGVVYLGTAANGARVAVKVLGPEAARDAESRQRFEREAAAARRVASFCTAQVLDADFGAVPPYIVSEYVDGPSLRDAVATAGPRTGAALHRLAVATATALVAIHEAGIVHRDLKPANVLLAQDGPRVIDFGIARMTDAGATLPGDVNGTPSYMAPEQIRRGPVGPPADVYAWGAVMVYAATGHPVHPARSLGALVEQVLHAEPDLSGLDGTWRELLLPCLDRDPARRPSAHDVLMGLLRRPGSPAEPRPAAAPLAAPVAPAALAAPPEPGPADGTDVDPATVTSTEVSPRGRSRRGAMALATAATAVAVVAALVGGAYLLFRPNDDGGQTQAAAAGPLPGGGSASAEPGPARPSHDLGGGAVSATAQASASPSAEPSADESAGDDSGGDAAAFPAGYAGTWIGYWAEQGDAQPDFELTIAEGSATGAFHRYDGQCDAEFTFTGADDSGTTASVAQSGPGCSAHTTATLNVSSGIMGIYLHPAGGAAGANLVATR
ncbi:serine/threonine-protein kinase [Allonocardiopsis opalescens]|uniref:Serine/threonine protein kinase n=1 Tax=Allonocardiopsis opalescens TaxID=1144618 RepID=A0A2T0QFF0_9ACTN|nr:serine/threonine-protein kinase [Allonocardiopsis opalescens]PRY02635.1 serine/threonine protein kinase [Allonocardiopsis opalescens]